MKLYDPNAPRYRYTGPARTNGMNFVRTGETGTIVGREDRDVVGFASDKSGDTFTVGREELQLL